MRDEALPVDVANLVSRSNLVGALMATADAVVFERALADTSAPVCWFDWQNVEMATASYIKAAYLRLFKRKKPKVIITSGLKEAIREDVLLVLENENRPIYEAALVGRSKRYSIDLIGPIDQAHLEAINLLKGLPSASARELAGLGHSQIGQTAWNNRLTKLFDLGLVIRDKVGKEVFYHLPKIEA